MASVILNLNQRLILQASILIAVMISHASIAYAKVEVSHINDVTHFELPDLSSTDYELKDVGDHLELLVSGVAADYFSSISSYSDQYVKNITVSQNSSLSGFIVKIYPANKNIKTFDYLTDSPAALSIDLYVEEEEVKKVSNKKTTQTKKTVSVPAKKKKKKTNYSDSLYERGPSSSEYIQVGDGGISVTKNQKKKKKSKKPKLDDIFFQVKDESFNVINFNVEKVKFRQDSIVESRGKIYLKYPMLYKEDSEIIEFLDKRVSYKITSSKSQENKRARLLKDTFSAGNYKKFLVAKRDFLMSFPASKYKKILTYMEADALYKLSQTEKSKVFMQRALSLYDSLTIKYPKSQLTERTILFAAFARVRQGDYLGAIKNFKYYLEQFANSPLKNQIKMYLAQNLLRVNNHKSAIETYENLIDTGDESTKRDAYFFIGDAHFGRKEYRKAIQAYNLALQKYPKYKNKFPNALFNKGEAEFLEEKYKDSLESYRDFLKFHEKHNYAPYAMTRLGEVFEIIGEKEKYWRGFYNESNFRYRNTIGGAVAKAHLLSHELESIEDKRLPLIIKQIKENQKNIDLPNADEFITFKVSDSYFNRGNYKKATDLLTSYFKRVKVPVFDNKFYRRIGRGISFQIRQHINSGEPLKALEVFEKNDKLWLRKSERLDFSLYKGIAYEKTNLYKSAIAQYEKFLEKFDKLPSKEDVIHFEELPSIDNIYLKTTSAYYKDENIPKAKSYLLKIKQSNLPKSEHDNFYLLSAKIYKAEANQKMALEKIEKIKNKSVESTLVTADLYSDLKNFQKGVDKIDDYFKNNKPEKMDRYNLLKRKAQILKKSNQSDKYYAFLKNLVAEYEGTNYDFDEERYHLGVYYLESDKTAEAKEIWEAINPDAIWKKMADESLKSKKWANKYDKYIDRIPAMERSKEKK